MKTNFNSKIFEKRLTKEKQLNLTGGNYRNSGGTESGPTNSCGEQVDTYATIYNDDCEMSESMICPVSDFDVLKPC